MTPAPARPPAWLIAATAALAVMVLVMAVAETSLWKHYLIDQGELISIGGLVFIALAGLYVHRQGRLRASLPLAVPWLLFPIITQGDQLIDNLSINWMRFICHVLLAAIFATPVAVVVLVSRHTVTRGALQTRRGRGVLAAMLLGAEIWVAHRFLGTLMIGTLLVMIAAVLVYAYRPGRQSREGDGDRLEPEAGQPAARERVALVVLLAGVALSFGLFLGYKNRPGAYQGSPAYYMDPSQADAAYPLDRIAAPAAALQAPPPDVADMAREALSAYGRALEQLVDGYYIADRNYNYAFHNELFLRRTPILPDFRRVALQRTHEAAVMARDASARADAVRPLLPPGDPLGALIDEVREYTDFNIRRSAILERMSGQFERTKAGLQHATHLYEGEGKVLGVRLMEALAKHRATTEAAALTPVTADFMARARAVHARYADRIVGF